ncbi:hypothetical protein ETQ85_25505 [Zoogloea oleivorans]|uniref:Transposase n=1 Tax=Zoogloea oleivorans TaxID=1552750 RepID=A0A6C2C8T4_9RHOO|nr:hypothetical protein ETQ85_25505 [Zoogloea oleivorans]
MLSIVSTLEVDTYMNVTKPRRTRRTHTETFKRSLIEACNEPGASVAGIALANGVNANQLRRWMSFCGYLLLFEPFRLAIPIARKFRFQGRLAKKQPSRQRRNLSQFGFVSDFQWNNQADARCPVQAFAFPGGIELQIDAFSGQTFAD